MLEKDKVEKGQDMYSLDLYDINCAKCKTPSSISAADMYRYCSQGLHKFLSLCRNPCACNFLSQNTMIIEKLNSQQLETKHFLFRLVPSRTQFCDRPLEL